MDDFIDAYAVLGVSRDADTETLKRTHRALVRRHHPDLAAPAERPAATRRVQEINVAYGLVRDPEARARYDRLLALQRARERAGAPLRETSRAVREADRASAEQWSTLLRAAGRWSGRWWRRNRFTVLGAARRARRLGTDLVGRVLWLVSCAVGLAAGVIAASAGQRLAGVSGVVIPLLGAGLGLLVGQRRGWRRRLDMAGLPARGAHRLRGWAELAAAVAVLAGVIGAAVALGFRA